MIDSVYLTPVENHLHLKEKSAHTADVCVCVCVIIKPPHGNACECPTFIHLAAQTMRDNCVK